MKKTIFLIFALVTLFSCKKVELANPNLENSAESVEVMRSTTPEVDYFYDNIKVSPSSFNPEDTSLNLIINREEDGKISILAYSSLAGYVSKGNSLGLNLQQQLNIESHLRNYAQSIGAIELFDQTGVIDPAYTAYETAYLASLPQSSEANKAVSGGVWFDDIWSGTNPRTIYTSISPFMWFGSWSNRVSSYVPLFLYGGDIIYDKTFFRKRMAIITGWAHRTVSFPLTPGLGFLNNKASSWLSFGL